MQATANWTVIVCAVQAAGRVDSGHCTHASRTQRTIIPYRFERQSVRRRFVCINSRRLGERRFLAHQQRRKYGESGALTSPTHAQLTRAIRAAEGNVTAALCARYCAVLLHADVATPRSVWEIRRQQPIRGAPSRHVHLLNWNAFKIRQLELTSTLHLIPLLSRLTK